jgi:hypothetical protein
MIRKASYYSVGPNKLPADCRGLVINPRVFFQLLLLLTLLWHDPKGLADDGNRELRLRQGKATAIVTGEKRAADRLEIRLSGLLTVTYQIQGTEKLEVEPIKNGVLSADWTIRKADKPKFTRLADGTAVWEQRFQLDPSRAGEGEWTLPGLRYRQDRGLGQWDMIEWRPIQVLVTTEILHADIKELRDLTGLEEVPALPAGNSWKAWAGAGLLALLIAVGVLEWWRRHRRSPPLPDPDQWALGEIRQIEDQGLPALGLGEHFSTLLSDVVRRYLEMHFHLAASRLTTAEFLESLRLNGPLSEDQRALLQPFLNQCDLVKFAKASLTKVEAEQLTDMARSLIALTTPKTPA